MDREKDRGRERERGEEEGGKERERDTVNRSHLGKSNPKSSS